MRTIGRWSLTALIINTMVGSGIYGAPSEVNAMVGRASPIAWVLAGATMGLMMACFAEVASQFNEAGGAYLYARTALGSFVGMQVAWFSWLAPIGACAASTNLLMNYLAGVLPMAASGLGRAALIVVLLGALTAANHVGVRSGTNLSNLFTVAKLLPLALVIAFGLARFASRPEMIGMAEIAQPGWKGWLDVLLLLSFGYAGFENALIPAGEMKAPRKEIPLALGTALAICIVFYALVQWTVVLGIGTSPTDRPLAAAATTLIGPTGAAWMIAGAMISAYGSVSAMVLASPRLTFSMAERGDFPAVFGRIHPRFATPYVSIAVFGALTTALALTGTFRWLLVLASGAVIVIYSAVCASLIALRMRRPNADAMRIPGGIVIACICLAIALVLLLRLSQSQAGMLGATFLLASVNWLLVKNKGSKKVPA